MISEPELEGEHDGDGEEKGRGTPPGPPTPPPGGGPAAETIGDEGPAALAVPRSRWIWALGGALTASVVWAVGLYVYHGTGPDLAGYRVSRDLCRDAELPALTAAVGPKRDPRSFLVEEKAIDRSTCRVELAPRDPGGTERSGSLHSYVNVLIRYTLHKETDPGPEFEALATGDLFGDSEQHPARSVPDLGERALLVTSFTSEAPELHILDGQAVLVIQFFTVNEPRTDPDTGDERVTERLDLSGIEPDLIDDMEDLMAALKK
jgi:hypothetical protein